MGIVCGRDRFGRTYAYQVPDIKGTAGVGGGPRASTLTGAGGVVGPLPGREAAVTLQIYLVTDRDLKVPGPEKESPSPQDGGSAPSSDAPCPGSDGSSSTERGKASNGQDRNRSRADGSDDDESTRSDTSATLPKPILRFLEWLFSGPL